MCFTLNILSFIRLPCNSFVFPWATSVRESPYTAGIKMPLTHVPIAEFLELLGKAMEIARVVPIGVEAYGDDRQVFIAFDALVDAQIRQGVDILACFQFVFEA